MTNMHIRRCSTLLTFIEMQIKTTLSYQLTPVRMAIVKKFINNKCWRECGGKGNLHNTVGGNCKLMQHYCGKQYKVFLKQNKTKIELLYHPEIPFPNIYPEIAKILIWRDTCTSMFIAVPFTVGKAGNICINIPVIRSCGYQKEGDINNSMLTAASCWYVAKTNTRSQSNYPPIKNILKILSIFFWDGPFLKSWLNLL